MRQLLCAFLTAGLLVGLVSRAPAADEARAIIDKAIKAHKGKAKAEKYTAIQTKCKGKLEIAGGIDFTQENSVQFPNKFKEVLEGEVMNQNFNSTTVYNGKDVWVKVNGEEVKLDKKKLLATMKEAAYLIKISQMTDLKDKKYKLSALGEAKVNGKPALGVKVSCKGQKDVDFYFDKKTGLLAKMERRTVDFMTDQEVSEERIITEYQEVEGRKVAKKLTVNRDGKKFMEVEVTEMKFVDKLDDSEFDKP
jgi:outer membrane lipoprotein-sorting protein